MGWRTGIHGELNTAVGCALTNEGILMMIGNKRKNRKNGLGGGGVEVGVVVHVGFEGWT